MRSVILLTTVRHLAGQGASRRDAGSVSLHYCSCCSVAVVAVLQKLFTYPKNTSIFIYKYRVKFWLSHNLFWNCNNCNAATASAEPSSLELCRAPAGSTVVNAATASAEWCVFSKLIAGDHFGCWERLEATRRASLCDARCVTIVVSEYLGPMPTDARHPLRSVSLLEKWK